DDDPRLPVSADNPPDLSQDNGHVRKIRFDHQRQTRVPELQLFHLLHDGGYHCGYQIVRSLPCNLSVGTNCSEPDSSKVIIGLDESSGEQLGPVDIRIIQ